MTGVAFIDTETTGLNPEIHPIWEIAVIVDGVEHCWQQRLTSVELRDADSVALEMTHFYKRYDPGFALSPADSLLRLEELIRGRHWVGAVPSFDEERVRRAWSIRLEIPDRWPWHYHLIDVEALAVGWLRGMAASARYFETRQFGEGEASKRFEEAKLGLPWVSDTLSRLIGVEPPLLLRHSALADARWAKAIYEKIIQ